VSQEIEARAKKATLAGAVLAAIAASSCCIGPLILAALGVGGASAFATLGAFRPYILGVTAALLAGGFYLTYRKPQVTAGGDACFCDSSKPKANRAARIGLWTATALVVVFASAPPLLAAATHAAPVPVAAGQSVEQATIPVAGLDCEACAAPPRKALTKIGAFHVPTLDPNGQTATASYDPAPGRLPAFVAVINEIRRQAPECQVEVLTPDFLGCEEEALRTVLAERPDVFNHNIETVRRLHARMRGAQASYDKALWLLRRAKEVADYPVLTKSGIIVGLGETNDEVGESMRELREHGIGTRAVAFSPDGRTLATAEEGGTVLLWETATWQLRRRLNRWSLARSTERMNRAKTEFSFEVHGPFEIPTYAGQAARLIRADEGRSFFSSYPALAKTAGCYVFGMRAGRGITPF